jgi:hypothetical protein
LTTSRVACTLASTICTQYRLERSGSIQSKLESIPEALSLGVSVDMNKPDITNGMTWRITFLDPSPTNALQNYKLSVNSNQVTTVSGAQANITVTQLVTGQNYGACTGTFQVPPAQALNNGNNYYARVFAVNEIGYSMPQVSATSQKPMVVPGSPTSVTLSVASSTSLVVTFNPPSDDGGDTITAYKVEYSKSSNFANAASILVTQLTGGPPFQRRINNLVTGTHYFVRVSAMNSQGFSNPTISTPSSLNPYQSASGPTGVLLYPTSSSMLTVSFGFPLSNGGDTVTSYRVEWDISPGFNSLQTAPNKGFVTVQAPIDGVSFASYTITLLTPGQVYYARVFAINAAGLGSPTTSSPAAAAPALQVPGRPHTVVANSGSAVGSIKVVWQRPRVPWHNIPCSGTPTSPADCPIPVGGTLPASDGGTPIVEFEVSYNELEDFSGYDSNTITTTNTNYVLTDLTPGRTYYIRVLARNAQGAGQYCAYANPNCLDPLTAVTSAQATPLV